MEFEFVVDGSRRTITLDKKDDVFIIRDGDQTQEVDIRRISPCELLVRRGGHSEIVYIAREGDRRFVSAGGHYYGVSDPAQDSGRYSGGDERTPEGGTCIKAPMPGRVIKLNVVEGEEVKKYQSLLIVEAMKMENDIRSAADGVVKKIHVVAGELVDSEKTLIELGPKT